MGYIIYPAIKQSQDKGYKNYLYFICTVDAAINIERIRQRVTLGGHAVPEDRIKKRYHESLQILSSIIPLCYRIYLFDNSSEERSIEPIAEIDNKKLTIKTDLLPWWVEEYIIEKLYKKLHSIFYDANLVTKPHYLTNTRSTCNHNNSPITIHSTARRYVCQL